jgi:hypothetical protein
MLCTTSYPDHLFYGDFFTFSGIVYKNRVQCSNRILILETIDAEKIISGVGVDGDTLTE